MAKRRKAKTPKKIAGVRIPKGMRRTMGPLARAVDTPLGREVVASAVVAAAVAAWRNDRVRMVAARVRDDARSWLRQTATMAFGPVEPARAQTPDAGATTRRGTVQASESVYGLEPAIAGDDAESRRTH